MERIEDLAIGSLNFDHANYDDVNDSLYLSVGEPQAAEAEETPEGHFLHYAPGTQRVVGLTLEGPRLIIELDGHLTVSVPETVEVPPVDLAPALAAI